MPEPEYHDYLVTIEGNVSAPTTAEARAAVIRSGIVSGVIIGEVLIEVTEVEER